MNAAKILIVDDYKSTLNSLTVLFESNGYQVKTASDGKTALNLIENGLFDLILLDVKMPGMDGFEVIEVLKKERPELPVIIMSAHDAKDSALKSAALGAFDFLEKPLDTDRLLITVRNGIERNRLFRENKSLKTRVEFTSEILGVSQQIQEIRELITRVAKTDARVMITGENGTGKELVARALHFHSARSRFPFIEINCAAIPQELIESELFGHEKGSFTGAANQRIGKFEQAEGGTLFMDEVGDMSLSAQAKVLRALQNNAIQRVGGAENIEVNVRVLAATNKNIKEAIEKGTFREDLFHRLNVIPIEVPPLRQRRDDIPILIKHFSSMIISKYNLEGREFSQEAVSILKNLEWKGNVRELQNVVERLLIISKNEMITDSDVKQYVSGDSPSDNGIDALFDETDDFQIFKDMIEKMFIEYKLAKFNGNISKTAEALNIQRSHLYNKIEKFGIKKKQK